MQIAVLCEKYGVIKLELLGSATTEEFDPDHSDFDFIATYLKLGPILTEPFGFIRFADSLEELLGRNVDVLTNKPMKNPYLARSINESRTTIYESASVDASL